MMKGKSKPLIIVHPNEDGIPCFDVFGGPELGSLWYKASECPFVKSAGRDDYRGSQDLSHVPEFNRRVMEAVNTLIELGYKVEFVGWDREFARRVSHVGGAGEGS